MDFCTGCPTCDILLYALKIVGLICVVGYILFRFIDDAFRIDELEFKVRSLELKLEESGDE